MKVIKLNAIDSTNDFLKELSQKELLENFTAVTAQEQFKGRGQMGAGWLTEAGKNLTMSVLVKDVLREASQVFDLNVAVSLSIFETLYDLNLSRLAIKWPNDILSDDRKIAGILIENRFRSDNRIESIVGIGLNVNQTDFSSLPQASSMALVCNKTFDVETVFEQLMVRLQRNCHCITEGKSERLWQKYLDVLFMKNVPMQFEPADKSQFPGIITGVTKEGQLEVMLENKSIETFGIKEVKLLY